MFYPPSPRYIDVEAAAALAHQLPPFVTPVALFVNADPLVVQAVCQAIPNALLQFHGDEDAAECEQYGRPYLKAARIKPGFDLLEFADEFKSATALLLDAFAQGYGGAGKVFDWSVIPKDLPCRVVLSGGLHPANVIDGVLQDNGMVSFAKVLTPQDAESIRAYVVHVANESKNAPTQRAGFAGPGGAPPPGGPPAGAPPATPARGSAPASAPPTTPARGSAPSGGAATPPQPALHQ